MLGAQLGRRGQVGQQRDVLGKEHQDDGAADQQQDQQPADDGPNGRAAADQHVDAERDQHERPQPPQDVPRLPGHVAQVRKQQQDARADEHQRPEDRMRATSWLAVFCP